MSRIVLLDASPLGRLSNPDDQSGIKDWVNGLMLGGTVVAMPEIADYEVRRELLRINRSRSIQHLDILKTSLYYVPISTAAMLQAAQFWAGARNTDRATAAPAALDGDVIVAAQARILAEQGHDVMVATDNVNHLSVFVPAARWQEIAA